ncbi:MAG TPA: type II toxin-antitoxin system RelE/ParE family toxin [Planctomycetaceae bacterium]|jgi:plasmid stabilization system protein ParE|nr:type II toxin-antitoxin system RelE/ParE family toxin [Planctomycetaceae bacterium]
MQLIYHPHAEAELIESAQYYEQQLNGLGADFLETIDAAILTIEDAPTRWAIVESNVRRYILPRFPFAIYYRVLPDALRILAIKHHSRHPDYWRYRLEG